MSTEKHVIRVTLQVAGNFHREISTTDPAQIGPWLLANMDKYANGLTCNATIRTWKEPVT